MSMSDHLRPPVALEDEHAILEALCGCEDAVIRLVVLDVLHELESRLFVRVPRWHMMNIETKALP